MSHGRSIALLTAVITGCFASDDEQDLDDTAAIEQEATTCKVLATGAAGEAQHAVQRACTLIGTPYSWGGGHGGSPGPSYGLCDPGNGAPNDCHVRGLDCSGMVRYAYSLAVGSDVINGTSAAQYQSPRAVARYTAGSGTSVLRPGDLVFFGPSAARIHHVAMFIGAGKIVEAPFSGARVRMVDMSIHHDYFGAIRLYKPSAPSRGGSSAVIDSAGVYHVFSIDRSGVLQQAYYRDAAWHWQDLGGTVTGTPSVTYDPQTGRYDVFAIAPNGQLYQKIYTGTWSPWHLVGGANLVAGAAAIVDRVGTYHVFVVDRAGQLQQAIYDRGWVWQALGGTVAGNPGVTYDAATHRFDVFTTSAGGFLYQKTYQDGWTPWHPIPGGGSLFSGASAARDRDGVYHVFAITAGGILHQAYYVAGAWHWQAIAGVVAGTPGVTYNPASDRFDVFAASKNGFLYQTTHDGSWHPFHSIGGGDVASLGNFDGGDDLDPEAN